MPATLNYPGVYIEEVPSGVRTITGVATSITAFVGFTRRGTPNKAEFVSSFADFERGLVEIDRRMGAVGENKDDVGRQTRL